MHIVIVGGGHAGAQTVATLCAKKWPGAITLVSEEAHLPYQRPPLSKRFLEGTLDQESLPLYDPSIYQAENVDVKLRSNVSAIDPEQQIVLVDGQAPVSYDRLVIATGSRPSTLRCVGSDCHGILYLRSLGDAERIREHLHRASSVVIVGGGYIGLEISAIAAKAGVSVTLAEASDRILHRVASPEVSGFFQRLHEQNGVRILTDTHVERFVPDQKGNVSEVITSQGSLSADLVVVGVGATPNIDLARNAGLQVDRGIHVDEHCRTTNAKVFAAGDCTEFSHYLYGNVRLENLQNANDQARTIANFICGTPIPYHAIPWFWSDQYNSRLQLCGVPYQGQQKAIRGNPNDGVFSIWHLADGRVIAVESIDNPRDFVAGKKLIEANVRISPDILRDTSFSLKTLL